MGGPEFHVRTSGLSYSDRVGPFCPTGTLPGDFLACFSKHFGAVEIDSTCSRIPRARLVDAWNAATPDGFPFSPKVPQDITHEKRLRDCAAELGAFLEATRRLGEKPGQLVLQFDALFQRGNGPEP